MVYGSSSRLARSTRLKKEKIDPNKREMGKTNRKREKPISRSDRICPTSDDHYSSSALHPYFMSVAKVSVPDSRENKRRTYIQQMSC